MLDKCVETPRDSRNKLPKLKKINEHITCPLCHGYLIGATTVTECLHTFCKSCIYKYLDDNCSCPVCDTLIHQSHPLWYVSFDRTIQDIVYKLVPNLQASERAREEAFYRKHKLPVPARSNNGLPDDKGGGMLLDDECGSGRGNQAADDGKSCNYHEDDEQIMLHFESHNNDELAQVKKSYLLCSSHATIRHLKRYLAMYVLHDEEKYEEIDILCKNELLGRDHTLKFIFLTRWRSEQNPLLKLEYRTRIFK